MFKKIITVLLVCLLLMGNFPAKVLAETSNNAIPISTKEELNNIRNDLSANYYLTQNIVFSESDFAEGGIFYNSGNGWVPIGSSNDPFTGTFSGNGYSILNLFAQSNTLQYMGLFGYNCGTISNVIISNSSFDVRSSYRDVYCGTLAGYNKGTITDSYCKGTVIAYSTAVDNNKYMNRLSVGGLLDIMKEKCQTVLLNVT